MPESSKDPTTAEDLTKLTVPQLKAICKEKKITAYSKLAKGAIIQKIVDHALSNGTDSWTKAAASRPGDVLLQQTDATQTVSDSAQDKLTSSSRLSLPITSKSTNTIDAHEDHSVPAPPGFIAASVIPHPSSIIAANVSGDLLNLPVAKRKAELPHLNDRRSKKPKASGNTDPPDQVVSSNLLVNHPAESQLLTRSRKSQAVNSSLTSHARSEVFVVPAPPVFSMSPPRVLQPRSSAVSAPITSKLPDLVQAKHPRRFIPLVLVKKAAVPYVPRESSLLNQTNNDIDFSTCLHYLDFPFPPTSVSLSPVTLPPSLSQRKRVTRLAAALSFVSPKYLWNLTQVSRLFRYAVYISAAQRLTRNFPGRRLADVMKQYSQNTTNMWPYLRQREGEQRTRQLAFLDSFLGRTLKGKNPISDHLWTSPDNVKQATLAVRFLLTRLFVKVSVGHEMEEATVVDVQELVEGEIWSVAVRSLKRKEVLYVLEATCEVVGHPPPPPIDTNPKAPHSNAIPLRADWSAYIQQHMLGSKHSRPPSLMERLKWTNHEEYYRGISRLWLSRTQDEGETGAAKRLVAERYILACVVSNSVSGRWMSSTEMAQDFNGLPSQILHSRRDSTLQLFLPAWAAIVHINQVGAHQSHRHHHIESLHFISSGRKPLHPAVAVVQTPGREYFILKDNGMQIGCEETGVAEIWMHLLGCDASGRPSHGG